MLSRLTDWLTPERRKAIYSALSGLGAVLTVAGLVRADVITGWLGIAQAGLAVLALLLASWRARRVEWTAAYAVAAALVTALKAAGIVEDGTASHALDVLAAVCAAAPLLAAAIRTDPSTPTGEPAAEYAARHADPIRED